MSANSIAPDVLCQSGLLSHLPHEWDSPNGSGNDVSSLFIHGGVDFGQAERQKNLEYPVIHPPTQETTAFAGEECGNA